MTTTFNFTIEGSAYLKVAFVHELKDKGFNLQEDVATYAQEALQSNDAMQIAEDYNLGFDVSDSTLHAYRKGEDKDNSENHFDLSVDYGRAMTAIEGSRPMALQMGALSELQINGVEPVVTNEYVQYTGMPSISREVVQGLVCFAEATESFEMSFSAMGSTGYISAAFLQRLLDAMNKARG